jgi:hypothetical protein
MIGVLSYALTKYFLTKNKVISGNGGHPWITPANLWPTFMLLGISTVTFFMNLITLISYTCGVGAANRTSTVTSIVVYAMTGLHVVLWAVAAGAYKMAQTENSLWGFACSDKADAIDAEVHSFIDFGKLCTMQVSFPSTP